ncbi:MAG TPA: glycosyltransferase [Reyranellaceae bacterium]|nr:glycosyltransferase [Reyranellaceae bacterium]
MAAEVGEPVTVVTYAHREHWFQERLERSVHAKTTTPYQWHKVIFPAGVHPNMNRALKVSDSRFICLLDEDVEILTHGWLGRLVDAMQRDRRLGLLTTQVFDRQEQRDAYEAALGGPHQTSDYVQPITWAPGYVMLFDRQKTGPIWADEAIPGRHGMSDVDISLEVTSRGLTIGRHTGVYVFHPHKDDNGTRARVGAQSLEEMQAVFPAQLQYMLDKWGADYVAAVFEAEYLRRCEQQERAWSQIAPTRS